MQGKLSSFTESTFLGRDIDSSARELLRIIPERNLRSFDLVKYGEKNFTKLINELESKIGYSKAMLVSLLITEGTTDIGQISRAFRLINLAKINAQIAIANNSFNEKMEGQKYRQRNYPNEIKAVFYSLLGLNGRQHFTERYDESIRSLTGLFSSVSDSGKPINGRPPIETDKEGNITYINPTAGQRKIADCLPLSVLNYLVLSELGYRPEILSCRIFDSNNVAVKHIFTKIGNLIIENTTVFNSGNYASELHYVKKMRIADVVADRMDTAYSIDQKELQEMNDRAIEIKGDNVLYKKVMTRLNQSRDKLLVGNKLDKSNTDILISLYRIEVTLWNLEKESGIRKKSYADESLKHIKEAIMVYEKLNDKVGIFIIDEFKKQYKRIKSFYSEMYDKR